MYVPPSCDLNAPRGGTIYMYILQVRARASMNPSTTSSVASLSNIGRWAVASLQLVEVLHLFRCYTHTHIATQSANFVACLRRIDTIEYSHDIFGDKPMLEYVGIRNVGNPKSCLSSSTVYSALLLQAAPVSCAGLKKIDRIEYAMRFGIQICKYVILCVFYLVVIFQAACLGVGNLLS